jgi:hypothetical protein
MLRFLVIGLGILLLVASAGYSAAIAGSAKRLGGGSAAVAQLVCTVTTSEVVVSSNAINTVKVTINCPQTRTYTVEAKVSNSTGTTTVEQITLSLTAGSPTVVTMVVSPTVAVATTPQTWYEVTYRVTLP